MARLATFIEWGQSNMQGTANLQLVAAADYQRWTGTSITLVSLPYRVTVPGIYYFTPRLPYGDSQRLGPSWGTTHTITFTAGDTEINVSPAPSPAFDATLNESWVWVTATTSGQQIRRIQNFVDADTLLVTPALTGPPAGNISIDVMRDSFTILTVNATNRTVQRDQNGVAASFPGTVAVGQWVVFINLPAIVGQCFKITAITTTTMPNDTITLDGWPSITPSPLDGFRVMTGSGGVNSLADYTASNSRFQALTFFYDGNTSISDGYAYANHQSLPLPTDISYAGFTRQGPDLELNWQLQHDYAGDIFVIKMGVGSAYMSKFLGSIPNQRFSWYDPAAHNDFHPASTDTPVTTPTFDLFDVLMTTVLTAARDWIANNRPGDTMDVQGIFGMEGESDSQDQTRANLTGTNMALIRDTMRARIDQLGVSSIAARKIPFVFGLIRTTDNFWTFANTTNTGFRQLEQDDVYTGVVETNHLTVNSSPDQGHYNAAGQVQFGKDLFSKWRQIRDREGSATTKPDERLTLSGLRARVRRRYERNDSSNLVNSNSIVAQFLNDAVRELLNTLGDNAWFLRRIETVGSLGDPSTPVSLPKIVKRLLRIESASYPGTQIPWHMVGMTENGRLRILVESIAAGPFELHHMIQHEELVLDQDPTLVPLDYSELLVLLACKRLSESGGNVQMAAYYETEVQRLYAYIKRDAQRYERQRRGEFSVLGAVDRYRLPRPW